MKLKITFLIFLALISVLGNADLVMAVDNLDDLSLESLMDIKVVTASKKVEKATDAPATVYVVTKKEIRERGYWNLVDLLKDLPGMQVIENYFSEQGTLVTIRGVVGNNKIVLLINGIRVNPPGGEELPLRSDISLRGVKQVEVIYGPGSTLYGQDAIAGVINLITDDPTDNASGEITAAYGNLNDKRGFASFNKQITTADGRKLGLTTYLQLIDRDLSDSNKTYPEYWRDVFKPGAFTNGGGYVPGTPERSDKGFNLFTKLHTRDSSLQIWHRDSSRSSSEGGYGGILQFKDQAVWKDKSTSVSATNTTHVSDALTLESNINFNHYEIHPSSRYVFPIGGQLYLDDYKYGRGNGTGLEEKFSYTHSNRFSVTGGIVIQNFTIQPKATIPGKADPDLDISSQAGSQAYYTNQGNAGYLVEVARAQSVGYQNFGVYTEGQYQVTDPFKIIAGLRADKRTLFSEVPLSPRLAAIYDVNKNFTLKYIHTQAFIFPAPYFSYAVYDNGQSINIPNPDLSQKKAPQTKLTLHFQKNATPSPLAFIIVSKVTSSFKAT